jgi:translocation and assembly module TamB
MRLHVFSNTAILANMIDGTRVIASADLTAAGPLKRPTLTGRVFVPTATIVADPFGASTALDLNSAAARELLGTDEVPVAQTAAQSLSRLGRFVNVQNAQVDFGEDVWVNTPEATVRVTGGLAVVSSGETIAPEGEINANRGTYRLNLGVVKRSFSIDSGSVRFFGNNALPATLDISATNVVRSVGGSSQIPVRVHIGGTLDLPVLTLSSPDPLFAGAPDSEIISLLLFGAPTFTLDGRSQSTVRAVAGVFVPSVGGVLEGSLQRLLPGRFETIQIQTSGQGDELTTASLLDNLSITAGKQLSDKTFLRFNTGVCRSSAAASAGVTLWGGLAIEYVLAPQLTLQVGVDPGASPCSRLGGNTSLPSVQFGFDLFREWIFR